MLLVAEAGHQNVLHVHDGIVIDDTLDSFFTLADTCQLMASPPAWAEGVSLDADRYECAYYRKD